MEKGLSHPGMLGYIEVVADDIAVPSPFEVSAGSATICLYSAVNVRRIARGCTSTRPFPFCCAMIFHPVSPSSLH